MSEPQLRVVDGAAGDSSGESLPVASHVHFGPAAHQVIPVHWASLFLTILFKENPQVFGATLVKVVGAELPGRRRPAAGQ